MKKVFGYIVVVFVVAIGSIASFLFLAPRPADTTDVSIFEGDTRGGSGKLNSLDKWIFCS